jgi:hypothetical protein
MRVFAAQMHSPIVAIWEKDWYEPIFRKHAPFAKNSSKDGNGTHESGGTANILGNRSLDPLCHNSADVNPGQSTIVAGGDWLAGLEFHLWRTGTESGACQ